MDPTDPRSQALEALALIRRRLEDVAFFEGRTLSLPEVDGPPANTAAPVQPAAVPATQEGTAEVADADRSVGSVAPEDATAAPPGDRAEALAAFQAQICTCTRCPLGQTRTQFVFGEGAADAGIAFVGEAPGADEDRSGRPFVGAAGQLLTRIIEAMQLRREEVYICNILKCRPPNNRDPQPDEVEQCLPYLKKQLGLVQPKVICALGRVAAHTLLGGSESMGRMRGTLHHWEGIPVIATYHPAALLRNQQYKRPVWDDVKWLRRLYDGVEL